MNSMFSFVLCVCPCLLCLDYFSIILRQGDSSFQKEDKECSVLSKCATLLIGHQCVSLFF